MRRFCKMKLHLNEMNISIQSLVQPLFHLLKKASLRER
ncbi:unnamed protein product [Onchocerca flexuosa]|uniref:Uncharacterized protein n=1 Tax=Onchocerca flexuosa TaxID=387005 RepID=A0A183H0A8_9BILA|nr:unnamed protein product [Onchocerca flexuosa]